MPELKDVINDLPPELADGDDDGAGAGGDDGGAGAADDGQNQDGTGDDGAGAADGAGDDDGSGGNADDGAGGDGNDDDYDVDLGDEPATPPAAGADKPAPTPPVNDEGAFILQNLSKIPVRIIAADDSIKTVEVYGWGDLPRDIKGFATPYEQGVFTQAVQAQELKARELQSQFRANKMQADTEAYVQRENKAIAEDLTELRQEGLFPKFKGQPGTKEFNESAGTKEFDKVIAFMNEQNDRYGKAAQTGKAYRHIGFREAFIMLNGPNPKAADQAEDKARREAAGKLKSSRGTAADTKPVSTKRVTNITDLGEEFASFVGSGAGAGAQQ